MTDATLIRAGCCELFALALSSLFPSVCLLQGAPTSGGFYYDFSLSAPLPPQFLTTLQEQMHVFARQNLSFEPLEMVPSNALEYFFHIGQEYRSRILEEWESPLVPLVRVGDFVDICPFKLPPNTQFLRHFTLLECIKIERGWRVMGVASVQKEEMKEVVRQWEPIADNDHLYWIKQRNFLWKGAGGWVWLPQGEEIRRFLTLFWEDIHKNFSVVSTPGSTLAEKEDDHRDLAQTLSLSRTAEISYLPLKESDEEGLLATAHGFVDQAYIFYQTENLEEELISSLQLIVKILKMFSFDFEVVFCFKNRKLLKNVVSHPMFQGFSLKEENKNSEGVEFRICDLLGRQWKGPSLRLETKKRVIVRSLFYSLERFLALLLEKGKGSLPLFLEKEQVRIISVDDEKVAALARFLSEQGVRFTVDLRKEKLSLKMHDALRERVPFSIVLGKETTDQLSVRVLAQKEPMLMTKETLINRLKQIENQ